MSDWGTSWMPPIRCDSRVRLPHATSGIPGAYNKRAPERVVRPE